MAKELTSISCSEQGRRRGWIKPQWHGRSECRAHVVRCSAIGEFEKVQARWFGDDAIYWPPFTSQSPV